MLFRPHLVYCILFWSLLYQNNVERLKRVHERATKVVKVLGSLTCEEQLREVVLFSLEKRRLSRHHISILHYLKKRGNFLFTRRYIKETRGYGCKLLLGSFQLIRRGNYFTIRTISHWNNLYMELVASPNIGHI